MTRRSVMNATTRLALWQGGADERIGLVRYSTIEDLREVLGKAPELAGLVQVAADAVGTYDPEREAVVLESLFEAVSVILVRETEVVTLGTLVFVDPS
jgi:hypothetical protein